MWNHQPGAQNDTFVPALTLMNNFLFLVCVLFLTLRGLRTLSVTRVIKFSSSPHVSCCNVRTGKTPLSRIRCTFRCWVIVEFPWLMLQMAFIIVAGICACLYFLFLCFMVFQVFRNISGKRTSLPAMSKARRLHYEVMFRLSGLLPEVICMFNSLTVFAF